MTAYMLAVHTRDGEAPPPASKEEMARSMQAVLDLEEEMAQAGVWQFSGRLTDPGSATVVRSRDGQVSMTDGPFVETKEHIAGFYVIDVGDLDEALAWGAKVTAAIGPPIEVRPFVGTGRAKDFVPTDG